MALITACAMAVIPNSTYLYVVAATSLLQQEDLSKINEQGLQDMVFFL
jgi:hypothetical protein